MQRKCKYLSRWRGISFRTLRGKMNTMQILTPLYQNGILTHGISIPIQIPVGYNFIQFEHLLCLNRNINKCSIRVNGMDIIYLKGTYLNASYLCIGGVPFETTKIQVTPGNNIPVSLTISPGDVGPNSANETFRLFYALLLS